MTECLICLDNINCQYAMIDNIGERGQYHSECLEQWIKTSKNRGILTQLPIETYTIFNADQSILRTNITAETDWYINIVLDSIYDNVSELFGGNIDESDDTDEFDDNNNNDNNDNNNDYYCFCFCCI